MVLSGALRRPRLIAAAACFLVGVIVLGVGMAPRLAPPSTSAAPAPADALLALGAEVAIDPPPFADPTAARDAPAQLVVYVTGAVPRPDVYLLPPGARVKDAVVAAGGLGSDAAAEQINLAEPLSDAAHIHVPSLAEAAAAPDSAGSAAATAPGSPAGSAGDGASLIDLNRASAAELEELPGIGKTIAERIVARRSEAGPYQSVEDLREVTGVGEKLYSQIAPLVTAGP